MTSSHKDIHQLSMDQLLLPSADHAASVQQKVHHHKIEVNRSTFKAGLAAHVHRWFRLTPSFGPDLVREMLAALKCGPDDLVFDPFAGAGTTMIECQLEGLPSIGVEINPFLHFVGKTSLYWALDPAQLEKHLQRICIRFEETNAQVNFDNLAEHGLLIPRIHDPTRWWRPDIIAQLLVLKSCIYSLHTDEHIKDFFLLALAGVLVPDLTNVTLGRLQLHFIDREHHTIQVLPTFAKHAAKMIADVRELYELGFSPTSEIFLRDSTQIGDVQPDKPVKCVITSPPYPNRYSYVWNTRPHLYFFDFMETPGQASALDKVAIGGTWGTATSSLMKGEIAATYPIVREIVGPLVRAIRERDNLMGNYAMKYFNLLAQQIVEMDRLLAPDARIAYVVGCSWLKEVYVETDVLLGQIIEGLGLGYHISSIKRIRSRHSGKDLYESIVYAWKK